VIASSERGGSPSSDDTTLIDAHLHLWHLSAHPWYPAMQDPEIAKTWAELGPLSRMARDFLFDDYIEETRGYEIDGLVHVSATSAPRAYLAEARWIEGVLDATGLPAAIVGAVEPTLSDRELESDLESQAISPRLRGVRVLAGLDPDSRLADRLCAWLAERRLVFDLVARPPEAERFRHLLDRHPTLEVVLEHAGWPEGTDAAASATWRRAISTLAENPNVSCKLSGLGMATHSLAADVLRPWVEGVLDVFGSSRLMFGSNFPVEAMYGTFAQLMAGVDAALAGLGAEEREAVLSTNARRLYRLPERGS
jgi:L-fuconolactonase